MNIFNSFKLFGWKEFELEGYLQVYVYIARKIWNIKQELVIFKVRWGSIKGGLNSIKIIVAPVLVIEETDLTFRTLNTNLSKRNGCTIYEAVVELNILSDRILRYLKNIDTFMYRNIALLDFSQQINNVIELISLRSTF
jgi:hypothetical protein